MAGLSPSLAALLMSLLLVSCEANIWASFVSQGNTTVKQHTHAPPPPSSKPDLCSDLVSLMEVANEGTPDTCQSLPEEVSGVVFEITLFILI